MKKIFFLLNILLIASFVEAQTGIGTTTPNASAKLDVFSTTKGFLPPRMTNAQRTAISSPAEGLMVYQTDGTSGLYYYGSSSWIYIINSTTNVVSVVNGGTGTTTSTGTGSVVLNTSPTLITPALGTPSSATLTNASGLPIASGVSGLGTGIASFLATPTSSNLASAISDETGSGALVFGTSPTLTTPALGTPSSATLTNASGLPIASGVSGLGTGIASFLATPTSSNLASAISDETGSGALVFGTSPSFTTPSLGAASATSIVVPTITGGSGTTQSLIYRSTSGNGTTGADHIFQVGNNGGTEAMRILNNSKVGIGTNSPDATLEIGSSNGSVPGNLILNPTTSGSGVEGAEINLRPAPSITAATWVIDQVSNDNNPRLRFFPGNTGEGNGLTIKDGGFIGIGLANPTEKLQVNGNVKANSFPSSSDVRFKTNIRAVENALDKVKALRGVYFNWNQEAFPEKNFGAQVELGFIAQEVEKIIPEIVSKDKSKEEYRSVKYDKVVALLVEAIKEQQKQIDSLTTKVNYLSKKRNIN